MSIRMLAAVAIAGPVIFAVAILAQDVIQYDYLVTSGDDPRTTSPISVNALGPYGWIQVVNFGVLGLSVLALAVAAHRGIRGASRSVITPALIALWGLGFLLSMFPIEREPHSFVGYMHGLAFGVVSFVPIPMYLFMWRRLRRAPGWEAFGRYSLVMGVLSLPLEVGSVALQQIVPFSWLYLWLAAHLLWCVLLGLRLWNMASPVSNA